MTGNNKAVLAARPQLDCNGGEVEAYPEERALNRRKRGMENMICVGNPLSLQFVEDVISELSDIFPSEYIHLGGDEVPTTYWEKCPTCQKLAKANGMTEPGQIQDHFTRDVSALARPYKKTMIGWD